MNFGWYCRSWISTFPISFFLSQFSTQNLQLRTLDGKTLVRPWVPAFLISISLHRFPFKKTNMNSWWVDVEEGARSNTYPHLIVSIIFIISMALEHILSIVLRSCPGTALVPMNFGWVDLGFLLLINFPFNPSCSKTSRNELWMDKPWISDFLLNAFSSRTCKHEWWDATFGRDRENQRCALFCSRHP